MNLKFVDLFGFPQVYTDFSFGRVFGGNRNLRCWNKRTDLQELGRMGLSRLGKKGGFFGEKLMSLVKE